MDRYDIADTARAVLLEASRRQAAANEALAALQSTTEALARCLGSVPPDVAQSVSRAVTVSAHEAGRAFTEQAMAVREAFERAQVQADLAAQRYENAARSTWRRLFVLGCGFLLVLAAVVVAATNWIPSLDAIESRRAQIAEMGQTLSSLRAAGGATLVARCDVRGRSRLCVRVDDVPSGRPGYAVIKGS